MILISISYKTVTVILTGINTLLLRYGRIFALKLYMLCDDCHIKRNLVTFWDKLTCE